MESDLSRKSKRVRILVPQVITINDYFLKRRAVVVYYPGLKLINLPRFNLPRFSKYQWCVFSKELSQDISIYTPLAEQGVLAGDTLDIWSENL